MSFLPTFFLLATFTIALSIDVEQTLTSVRTKHHTTKYKTDALIVRRGFSVNLATSSNRLFLQLIPVRSSRSLNSRYSVTVSTSSADNGWSLTRINSGQVSLFIPVDAKVGLYGLYDLEDSEADGIPIVVLFNPYEPSDPVYMASDAERNEYVQRENGRMWSGTSNSFSPVAWAYAQFRMNVLLSAIDLMDRIPVSQRHDPIQVTRKLSALVNANDRDGGVIVGRWSEPYDDGVSPTAWTGSLEVLTQYWESGGVPVKYGQCWVFAGVFTSVLRTLGIPSMPISNFDSAHERKPFNQVIDYYYDSDGEPLPRLTRGSIWNFHVWNMVWMTRPDLKSTAARHRLKYDGWQVVDATPQEQSTGIFQLGPCPVEAIKHGRKVSFDVDFVFGEVNADLSYHIAREQPGGRQTYEEFYRDTSRVGQRMSVKSIGFDSRRDITRQYKFAEGSAAERNTFEKRMAARWSARNMSRSVRTPGKGAVLRFAVDTVPQVLVGHGVTYALLMEFADGDALNKGMSVYINILVEGTDYTGRSLGVIKQLSLKQKKPESYVLSISAEEYEMLLSKGMVTIRFESSVVVRSSGTAIQAWAKQSLVRVDVDKMLAVRLSTKSGAVRIGESFDATVVIENVSHLKLTSVTLRLEGEGLLTRKDIVVGVVNIGSKRTFTVTCKATQPGDRLLIVSLDSNEILNVASSVNVNVLTGGKYKDTEDHGWEGDESQPVGDLLGVLKR